MVERLQIGSHLFLRQHSIVAGQAARRKESVIGVQRRHIVGIDRQPREPRRVASTHYEGVILREEAVEVGVAAEAARSEEHTSELQALMRISYAVFCLKKKTKNEDRLTMKTKK